MDVVFRVDAGEHVICLNGISNSALSLPRVPFNPVVSVIPINYGCLGNCSYCCVHFARGPLKSNSVIEVVERVHRDVGCGVKEFWLTSQDTACYGKDIGTSLPELLQQVCKVEGRFFVRLGMMNPDHVLDIVDELVGHPDAGRVDAVKPVRAAVPPGDSVRRRGVLDLPAVDRFEIGARADRRGRQGA